METPNCGSCVYYKNGKCFRRPPKVFIKDGVSKQVRPKVSADDVGCSFHTAELLTPKEILERQRELLIPKEPPFPEHSLLGLIFNPR